MVEDHNPARTERLSPRVQLRPAAVPLEEGNPRSLRQNFAWTLGGNVIGMGCQWLLIVFLAKLMNASAVGELALALAVAGPITFLADFRLRVLYVTDVKGRWDFGEMLGLRLALVSAALVIIAITCMVARFSWQTSLVVAIVGLSQLTDSVSESFFGEFQRNERMDRIAKSLAVRNLLAACTFTALIFITRNLVIATTALVASRMAVLLLYDSRARSYDWQPSNGRRITTWRLRPAWNFARQRTMLVTAVPLAIIALLVSVNGYVPRYVLEGALGKRDVGVYSAISYIPAGCFMVASALGYAVFARLAKLFGIGDLKSFKALLLKVVVVYGALGVAGVAFSAVAGALVLNLVYGPAYAARVDILHWLMLVGAVQTLTTALQCGLTAASRFGVQVPMFAIVTLISFLGCVFLIPRYGLRGAAVAVLISSLVQLCFSSALMISTFVKRLRELDATRAESFVAPIPVC